MSQDAYVHLATPPAPGAPLVFASHDTGGEKRQFTGLIAGILPRAGIVSPRGDVSEHGLNRLFRRSGERVCHMADLTARIGKMASFVQAHRNADPGAPVYGLGYSNEATSWPP